VAAGATFTGLHPDGNVELVLEGVREVEWGCGTLRAAAFSAEPKPASGIVWVVADPGTVRAARAIERREPEHAWRLYRLPQGGELDLKPGRTVVETVSGRPWVSTWSGAGADLLQEDRPGPHWPDLVLLDGDAMWLVLRNHEAGSFGWDLVQIVARKGAEIGRQEAGVAACPTS
jgi:hypothetical protein